MDIPAVREKIRVKISLAVTTAAPTTYTEEIMQTPPLAALKTIKILSMQSKAATYLLNFLLHVFLWFISCLKQLSIQSSLFYQFHSSLK